MPNKLNEYQKFLKSNSFLFMKCPFSHIVTHLFQTSLGDLKEKQQGFELPLKL